MYKSNPHVWNEGPMGDLVFHAPEHKCTNLTHTFGMRDLV